MAWLPCTNCRELCGAGIISGSGPTKRAPAAARAGAAGAWMPAGWEQPAGFTSAGCPSAVVLASPGEKPSCWLSSSVRHCSHLCVLAAPVQFRSNKQPPAELDGAQEKPLLALSSLGGWGWCLAGCRSPRCSSSVEVETRESLADLRGSGTVPMDCLRDVVCPQLLLGVFLLGRLSRTGFL